jgi:hypothetical protein
MITGNPSLRTAENTLTSFFKFLGRVTYIPFLKGKAQQRKPVIVVEIVKTAQQIGNSRSIEKPAVLTHSSSAKAPDPNWKPFQFSLNPDPFDWRP